MVKKRIKDTREDRALYFIFYLFLTLLLIITLYPMYFVVVASFSDPTYVNSGALLLWPKGFHFTGYEYAFAEKGIWTGYLNTIFYAVGGTSLGLIVSLMAAYGLSRNDLPGRKLFNLLLVFTMYFNGGLIPTYIVVQKLGLVNTRTWMVLAFAVSAYNIILIRTFFRSNIPQDLLDAASIDGCGNIRFFISIVLPLSKAIIAVIGLYLIVTYWNAYFTAMIYLNDADKYPLQIYLRKILMAANATREETTVGEELRRHMMQVSKYAVIVLSTLPVMCAYPFLQKYFVQGVMIGSLKA